MWPQLACTGTSMLIKEIYYCCVSGSLERTQSRGRGDAERMKWGFWLSEDHSRWSGTAAPWNWMLNKSLSSLRRGLIWIGALAEFLPKHRPELGRWIQHVFLKGQRTFRFITGRPHISEVNKYFPGYPDHAPIEPTKDDIGGVYNYETEKGLWTWWNGSGIGGQNSSNNSEQDFWLSRICDICRSLKNVSKLTGVPDSCLFLWFRMRFWQIRQYTGKGKHSTRWPNK